MPKRILLALAAILFASVFVPLSSSAQPFRKRVSTPSTPLSAENQLLWNAYFHAIFDSSVYQAWNLRQLRPLLAEADGTVLVSTLTSRDATVGETISSEEGIWVTGVPEVQVICRNFRGDVVEQLRQLLGLPPDADAPWFLVLRAKALDTFRPSPYEDIYTKYPCALTAEGSIPSDCGNVFPTTATPVHIQWIASQSFSLHKIPDGYPWTHLGYTYNWAPGKDRYGASEYVIRPGAPAVVLQKVNPVDYCAPLAAPAVHLNR
jgi:hypothetical protein